MNVNRKNTVWKFASAFVVMFLVLNPEMVHLAIFIDAIGLQMFLMLLDVQVLAILGAIVNTKIKPILAYARHLCAHHFLTFSWRNIKEKAESLMLVAPSQATIMCMLAFSAAIGIVPNAVQ